MKIATGAIAACSGFLVIASAVQAEDAAKDPLFQGRTIELSFGLFAPGNTLQDTLTTLNNDPTPVQSTSLLDFGSGGRANVTYSNPVGAGSRLVVGLTGARAEGEVRWDIGTANEAFPGIFDDGFRLPANSFVDSRIDTSTVMLSIGKEWARGDNWRFSAGIQGGTASQDISNSLYGRPPLALFDGELFATIDSASRNMFAGVYGGVSHYSALGNGFGLRLSGNLGVMRNTFDFDYTYINRALFTAPNTVRVSGSDTGTTVSAHLAARLERSVGRGGLMSFEVGYEGLYGLGNGVDTFLDVEGTNDSAQIDSDTIGATYLSVGYTFRF